MNTPQIVEAVLFASDAPLTADEIARADERLDEDQVEEALQMLKAEYDDTQHAFHLTEIAEGYQILTRPEFAPYLERFDNVPRPNRLSGPSLETLNYCLPSADWKNRDRVHQRRELFRGDPYSSGSKLD